MYRSICSAALFAAISLGPWLTTGQLRAQDDQLGDKTIEKVETADALEKRLDLDVIETPLQDVLEFLSEESGIQLYLDRRAIAEIGLSEDAPVSFQGHDLKLRSILGLILRDLDMTWLRSDGMLLITTPEEAEVQLETVVLDVTDLLQPYPGAREATYDYDSLIALITSIVAPSSWDCVGGPGAIAAFRGSLSLAQTREVIEEIQDVLAAIRQARRLAEESPDSPPTSVSIALKTEREGEAAILSALSQEGDYDFFDTPLEEVIGFLGESLNINIRIDTTALDDVGIGTDVPITFRAHGISARQMLHLVLRNLDLTWMLLHESLLITTPEEAECSLVARAYPVADLLGKPSEPDVFGDRHRMTDMDQLLDMVTSLVIPYSWDDVGGPASIGSIPHIDVLVISQTQDAHEKLAAFFAKLRDHLAKQQLATVTDNDEAKEETYLLIYHIPSEKQPAKVKAAAQIGMGQIDPGSGTTDGGSMGGMGMGGMGGMGGFAPTASFYSSNAVIPEEELLALIIEMVQPQSWERDDVSFRCVPGRLLIQQTEQVHRQIRELLERLGIPSFIQPSNGGLTGNCSGTGVGCGPNGFGAGSFF